MSDTLAEPPVPDGVTLRLGKETTVKGRGTSVRFVGWSFVKADLTRLRAHLKAAQVNTHHTERACSKHFGRQNLN